MKKRKKKKKMAGINIPFMTKLCASLV